MLIELAILGSTVAWLGVSTKKRKTSDTKKTTSSPTGKKLLKDVQDVVLDQSLSVPKKRKSLLLSTAAISTVLLGINFPSLYLFGSLAAFYLARHFFYATWQDLKQGRYITVYAMSSALAISMILTGNLLLATLGILASDFMVKLVKRTEENSQKHLVNIFSEQPSHVWLEKQGIEIQVPFDNVQKNDIVVVHAGEIIPVDGVIQQGIASIDQHVLTGESQAVEKNIGDEVFAATLALTGRIHIKVNTAGNETVAAKIGDILNNTKSYKENLTLRGKQIADGLLPVELGAGGLALALISPTAAMAALWSGLGYRMMVYGPISVLNYLQIFSRQGILIKDGRVLESLHEVDTVIFDKTGTLTLEQPTISHTHLFSTYDATELLTYAASAEYRQTHPIAKAILDKANEHEITLLTPDSTYYVVGYGIKVQVAQKLICVGSARFMQRENIVLPSNITEIQHQAEQQGHSLIYVAIDDELAGILEMQPSIRPEAKALIDYLHQRGLSTYIISGDHEQPTRNIANQLGVQHYFAETLPEHKADLVKQLRDEGKFVCFIGDGINDAIALKSAQVSISMKGASSAATDTAQIIFMNGSLTPLFKLFELTDDFEKNMNHNLFLSIAPGILNIGGVYVLHFGLATSMSIFYLGSVAGLANTLLPFIKHHNELTSS
ncbi:heavy metal translocating P-type ATPase [Candidatus Albibeggiatoa sp. nov. NOAA]|uniref:heavy metal translocating P-type ATPase n=1 Tax=Candidatus Albibeggiatoa sp. nov. NOAA TaxID=3162724 RepID=UPI0032FE3F55|nr:heavy metal translocating P-type ATPase [Thiotrichaceae bacterium]